MVQEYVGNPTESRVRRVWDTSTTLQSDVHIAYHYKRQLSELEDTSRKLDAILYVLSSEMGIWEKDGNEDVSESDGDC
jgi:hypothetical protein